MGDALRLRLRTQLIIATLITSSALTGVCLLLVRNSVKSELDQQRNEAMQSSTRAFDRVELAQQLDLARVAALLSELPTLKALMTSGHAATIQDASTEFWKLSRADLLVLAIPGGRVMGVHAAEAGFELSTAQRLLSASLARHEQVAWWQEGNELFRVVLRPIVAGVESEQRELGLLVVGQHINAAFAQELAHSSGSQIVLISGNSIVASTLNDRGLLEFSQQVYFQQAAPRQLQIENHQF